MSTRRETLVTVLNGGTPSVPELVAMSAVPGVQEFLAKAAEHGVDSASLVDRLRAFKDNGGSGLANAIEAIGGEFDAPAENPCNEAELEAIKADLIALVGRVTTALES